MRTWLAALVISIVALAAAGALGTAGADPVAPAGQRSITVNGTGSKALPDAATSADRDAAYEAALGAALDQAQATAQLVARKLGASLGQVYSVAEQSQEDVYPCGEVIAFARPGARFAPTPSAPAPRRSGKAPQRPHARPARPRIATQAQCREDASVSVTYLLG